MMSAHLGNYFKKKRLDSGLRVPDLARQIGYKNVSKGSKLIHDFENGGFCSKELLAKLIDALAVDLDLVVKLATLDHENYIQEFLAFINSDDQPKPSIVIRIMATMYGGHQIPDMTRSEAEIYASALAKKHQKQTCLIWSRKISCYFSQEGNLLRRTKARPNLTHSPHLILKRNIDSPPKEKGNR